MRFFFYGMEIFLNLAGWMLFLSFMLNMSIFDCCLFILNLATIVTVSPFLSIKSELLEGLNVMLIRFAASPPAIKTGVSRLIFVLSVWLDIWMLSVMTPLLELTLLRTY